MPWKYPNIFYWMDFDCVFPNPTTGDVHIIEIKTNNAPVKPYQNWLLEDAKKRGYTTHTLRMEFNPKYFGDHENLGDPRLADKIILDDEEVTYGKLIETLNDWHGTEPKKINIVDFVQR